MNNKAMYNLTYGLFICTARDGDKDNGCIVYTVSQVTTSPNRIVVAVNKDNYTHDMIMKTKEFNISILTEKASFDTFKHWGFQSGKNVDKAIGIEYCRSDNGIIYIANQTNAYISATVEQTINLGSHTMFIASVDDMEMLSSAPSASYAYYQSSIKPRPEEKILTGKTVWRCTVCGYVYEGEELPADFVCPLCKHPASDFEKVTS